MGHRIILIRHGETEENLRGILQGHRYGTLTTRGRAQIDQLAHRLADEPVSRILSSDLDRARYTSERIAERRKAQITLHPELRERYLGPFEGSPVDEYARARDAAGGDPLSYSFGGSESLYALRERAIQAWREVIEPVALVEPVIVSAHGLFNRVLLAWLLGYELSRAFELEQENTCVNLIDVAADGRPTVTLLNCTAHLPSELSSHRGKTNY